MKGSTNRGNDNYSKQVVCMKMAVQVYCLLPENRQLNNRFRFRACTTIFAVKVILVAKMVYWQGFSRGGLASPNNISPPGTTWCPPAGLAFYMHLLK